MKPLGTMVSVLTIVTLFVIFNLLFHYSDVKILKSNVTIGSKDKLLVVNNNSYIGSCFDDGIKYNIVRINKNGVAKDYKYKEADAKTMQGKDNEIIVYQHTDTVEQKNSLGQKRENTKTYNTIEVNIKDLNSVYNYGTIKDSSGDDGFASLTGLYIAYKLLK